MLNLLFQSLLAQRGYQALSPYGTQGGPLELGPLELVHWSTGKANLA